MTERYGVKSVTERYKMNSSVAGRARRLNSSWTNMWSLHCLTLLAISTAKHTSNAVENPYMSDDSKVL